MTNEYIEYIKRDLFGHITRKQREIENNKKKILELENDNIYLLKEIKEFMKVKENFE